ncbi:DUF805 domain-containing protein [Sphingomonas sp. ERG5]|uniref:DUF805 domain-containing protein n=1 Tax=Sphingomonas sp. ERG5 TaxID=1381597 RepID=UPI00054BF444
MEWMLLPLKRYADFSGRSRRKEYWMFALGLLIFYAVLTALIVMAGGFGSPAEGRGPSAFGWILITLSVLAVLALVVPSIAVQVRRFHDQDKSGWFVLISLIPYVGGFIVLVFMCLPGTSGTNRFGPDPLDPNSVKELSGIFN